MPLTNHNKRPYNPFAALGTALAAMPLAIVQSTGKLFAPSVSFANKVRRAARAEAMSKDQRSWLWHLAYSQAQTLDMNDRYKLTNVEAAAFFQEYKEKAKTACPAAPKLSREARKLAKIEARAAKKLAKLEAKAVKTVERTAKAEAKVQVKNALHHRRTA